jgi:hypothetical protein
VHFPNFQFSLSTLSMLASTQGKACLLLAVLEVNGPDEVTVRRRPDARVRHLCVVSHRRWQSKHDPQAHGMVGSRGDVGRRDTGRRGHTLR